MKNCYKRAIFRLDQLILSLSISFTV